ncbi:Signal transduction response regulator, receiver domain [Nitrospira sp. KM1]|nr:Signal transduction response regulator, receiver domain [Nitrospira sp. KM1]
MRRVLEAAGYAVTEASNGHMALQRLETAPSDLLILDIFMPEKDGLELLRRLRSQHSTARVIAISGGGDLEDTSYLAVAARLGAHQILEKPFDSATLLRSVTQQLTNR